MLINADLTDLVFPYAELFAVDAKVVLSLTPEEKKILFDLVSSSHL